MFPGMIDPALLKKAQTIGQHISGKIVVNYDDNTVTLDLAATTPESRAMLPTFIDKLAESMASQLGSFFAIKGEIVEVGTKDETVQ